MKIKYLCDENIAIITNPKISKRIENYETGVSKLVSVSIDKLKENSTSA